MAAATVTAFWPEVNSEAKRFDAFADAGQFGGGDERPCQNCMFMMSVNAATPLFTRATVTWVSSDAWVASIMASVTLPCPAAACASAVDAVFWRLLDLVDGVGDRLGEVATAAAAARPRGGSRREGLDGRDGGDHSRHVPRVRADW